MTIAPHILASSAVATAVTDSLPVAFLIGFFLHFIIDAIPHVDPGTFFNMPENKDKSWPIWIYIFAFTEFIIMAILMFLLFKNKPNFDIIIAGGLGGIFVDILDNNPFRIIRKYPVFKQIHWLHEKVHYDLPKGKWYWGIPAQIVFIGVSLWYLLKF